MENKTNIKNESVENSNENDNLNAVCTHLQFSDNDVISTRKRCVSSSILISPSPKKKKKDSQNIIPPNKFLLGGNISDPLNLNSLQNDDINKAMNKTPKSSPLHSNTVNIKKDHVNVIIPRDLSDPLELSTCETKGIVCLNLDLFKRKSPQKCAAKILLPKSLSNSVLLTEDSKINNKTCVCNDEENISSPPKKKLKTKTEKLEKKFISNFDINSIPCEIVDIIENIKEEIDNQVQPDSCDQISNTQAEISDKIIEPHKVEILPKNEIQLEKKNSNKCTENPVVEKLLSTEKKCDPQHVNVETISKPKQNINKNKPKFKEKNEKFKYGNYNRYYGYRNPDDEDSRLKVLAEYMNLFYNKDVLDIGCNIGHVTFSIARDFGAKSVVGMDIDRKLINIARKNVQYYINDTAQASLNRPPNYQFNNYASNSNDSEHDLTQYFPKSLPILYGPINLPGMTISGRFPHNVSFVQGNYVLESDTLLSMESCKFDVILCLSITKWIHLNWGDDGLKRAFKRMYAQLRQGGILVVEPQPWKSYSRRKTLTETIWQNYKNIQLKPPMFTEYLLNEVGFSNCETLAMPHNSSKGFQRPLKLFRKHNITN